MSVRGRAAGAAAGGRHGGAIRTGPCRCRWLRLLLRAAPQPRRRRSAQYESESEEEADDDEDEEEEEEEYAEEDEDEGDAIIARRLQSKLIAGARKAAARGGPPRATRQAAKARPRLASPPRPGPQPCAASIPASTDIEPLLCACQAFALWP